ncbi:MULTISPECIES: LysR family transcriptional regulator [Streptomyces]|uniref:LysR family transcriptional regulator n=2 Tax=Streptomyces microflavus subgroup TaxID=1482601 RepID=A0A7H8MW96_STRMI|nr:MULTISPECIES: LysR family transcriptional regulator [Streptomyces]MBW3362236.1 LysR family transcriptional regulator [Streptomyces sp. 09ZI22]QKW46435.1 LysR family transcriptional regulator [Streptomyces microflavus]QQZ57420.1 LysR family transcriptional regulator [Streptomyces microflavus]QTA35812.1 LysR family transcriptional regulator [Streptomyces sp. CA-256286]WSR94941.1 LysR family transcriptional regulator [Streptomyces microflavus]
MELRQLEHFVAVAEEQHFTRAAERLAVSQSGLSASVRALEQELRTPLFSRTTRTVRLTEAGRALLVEAERTLAGARAARDAVDAVRGLLRGTLTVGVEQCVAGVSPARLLAAFHREHPQMELRLRQEGTSSLLDGVAGGRLDLAFAATVSPAEWRGELMPLAREPMVVLCAAGHRFAGRGGVAWEELPGESFIDFHPDWGPRRAADEAFAAAGARRTVGLEVNDVHSLLELVQEGLGIAVVPHHFSRKPEAARLVAVEVAPAGGRQAVYESVVVLPAARSLSPGARALMRLVREDAVREPEVREREVPGQEAGAPEAAVR